MVRVRRPGGPAGATPQACGRRSSTERPGQPIARRGPRPRVGRGVLCRVAGRRALALRLRHSLVGDQIFYVALTWTAVQLMSPAMVGLVLVLGSVPRAVVLLAGGVLVDRIGPKRIIIVSDVARTLVMVAAAVLLGVGLNGTLLIGVLAVVFGFVDGIFLPAVGAAPAFVTTLAGQTRLQAIGRSSTAAPPWSGPRWRAPCSSPSGPRPPSASPPSSSRPRSSPCRSPG